MDHCRHGKNLCQEICGLDSARVWEHALNVDMHPGAGSAMPAKPLWIMIPGYDGWRKEDAEAGKKSNEMAKNPRPLRQVYTETNSEDADSATVTEENWNEMATMAIRGETIYCQARDSRTLRDMD